MATWMQQNRSNRAARCERGGTGEGARERRARGGEVPLGETRNRAEKKRVSAFALVLETQTPARCTNNKYRELKETLQSNPGRRLRQRSKKDEKKTEKRKNVKNYKSPKILKMTKKNRNK